MAKNEWKWADLDSDQLEQLQEGEQTLGADILIAYQPASAGTVQDGDISQSGFSPASLTESQIECLQGLEQNIHAVVIAYQRR